MQTKIMEQVKCLEPLSNSRIALSVDQAVSQKTLLACSLGDLQFNHVMRDGLQMGVDFEVISKDQWCLLAKYFGELVDANDENGGTVAPTPLIRSYELLGLGIRTQIEYFF